MPPDKDQNLRQQHSHARSDLLVRLVHAGVPWALFLLLTIAGNILHLVSAHVPAVGAWLPLTVGLTAVSGSVVAGLDYHLRASHRQTVVGRTIGPVTTEAATVMLSTFLVAGYSVPLVLIWMFGGLASCIGWDLWLALGQHHDLSLSFTPKAEQAGLGAARLVSMTRQPKAVKDTGSPRVPGTAPARPRARKVTGTMALPRGEVSPAEAAERAAHFEGAHGYPPGAATITPNASDGAFADFTVTDPGALDIPDLWPGPSAPSADMSVSFRVGTYQDGTDALIPMLPLFHKRAMGQTGAAKTMGWGYNQLGEGVTREGYAAIVMDISKGEQFFGAWRPALHRFETEPDRALRLLRGLNRARLARSNFLAKTHRTEWEPGCGLSYLDIFMAEAPDIIRLLETAKGRFAGALMTLPEWTEGVRNGRSAGECWNLDLQLTLATEIPSVAQDQMSHICLGVGDKEKARYGLSTRQRDAGCRPELWGAKKPGMAYWDAPTIPDEYGVMPMRFYYWQGGARQAFEYAELWPAAERPLDDVTAEALENEPALPASYALPGPGGTLAGSPPAAPADPRAVVRQLFPGQRAGAAKPDHRLEAAARAEGVVFSQLDEWEAAGKTVFDIRDLQEAPITTGRSRSWLYGPLKVAVVRGRLKVADTGSSRTHWQIIPQADRKEL